MKAGCTRAQFLAAHKACPVWCNRQGGDTFIGAAHQSRGDIMQSAAASVILAGLLAFPALAQQPPAPAPGSPAGQIAETGTVAVSQLKLVSGLRASKLIGAAVYNDANERIGTVDDLILSPEDKAVAATIQVGGFLGVGGKLVAVRYHQLQADKDNKLVLAGANKDSLNVMPGFTYGG
jgi:sporulation protein YlmC with PRC-barrel domain